MILHYKYKVSGIAFAFAQRSVSYFFGVKLCKTSVPCNWQGLLFAKKGMRQWSSE